MEITKKNDGYFLGYKDNETTIFINEENYKEKFEQYRSDPDNPKWEQIANAGREYTMNNQVLYREFLVYKDANLICLNLK